ncbi:hypothetical protein [Desulfotignum balticum]|uniref:hypothetical protein n=1 Tax=Desulfotignum balticum TaxID=115781 RepID=UPI0004189342|nr:hypothetical protein [Desulfotignum balticum]
MNREPTRTPVAPWEWYSGAIYHLGKSLILKIWNCSGRTLERWSADPATTESITKNPLGMLGITLEKLMERGRTDFARAAVDYLAGIVGCTLVCDGEIHPDKETLADECLDDLPALAEFHTALREGQPLPVVRELCRKAKHDIDESLAIYEAQANSIENKRY